MSNELVVGEERFVKGLISILGKYTMGNPILKPITDTQFCFTTEDGVGSMQVENDTLDIALQIKSSTSLSVGCQYSIRTPIKKHKVGDVAIQQLGFHFYDNGIRFCRAEWDLEQDDKQLFLIHPQPHWHFDRIVKKEDETFDVSESTDMFCPTDENKEEDDLIDNLISSDRYHFAMQSDWNNCVLWQNHQPQNIKELFLWAENSVVGIINEYSYAKKHKKFKNCYNA